jgi:hypothetical protein
MRYQRIAWREAHRCGGVFARLCRVPEFQGINRHLPVPRRLPLPVTGNLWQILFIEALEATEQVPAVGRKAPRGVRMHQHDRLAITEHSMTPQQARLPRPLRLRSQRLWPELTPTGETRQPPLLDLQPGELVEMRPQMEIEATLDPDNARGPRFYPGMLYCGTRARVVGRVDRIIDERTGRMLKLRGDCVVLEGLWCEPRDWQATCSKSRRRAPPRRYSAFVNGRYATGGMVCDWPVAAPVASTV